VRLEDTPGDLSHAETVSVVDHRFDAQPVGEASAGDVARLGQGAGSVMVPSNFSS